MKKLTLFLVAMLFSALSFAALNPYAYGLSSSLDGTTLTVNYSLNAPATAVSVVIMDGETEVKAIDCDGTTKGSHSVDVSTLNLPTGKSLTWKVVVKGTSGAGPTIQSDLTLKYCLPRGIGVDRSTESPYFGRIYTTDATGGTGYHASEGIGLYVFDAALNPITNSTGGKKFTGGITYGTDDIGRVEVSNDGRVFLSRFNTTGSPVLEVNPANLDENFKNVFTSITGSAIGIDVKGAGDNLQLVMLSKTTRVITEYDLKTATQWTSSTPSRTYTKKDLTTGKALSLVTDNAYISYDLTDGVWLTQHRATATTTEPTIAHVIPSGMDYNNFNAGLSHNGTSNGGIAISPDGKLLAVVGAGTKKLTIYSVSRDNGDIALTSKYTISTSGSNHTALEWDYAGNLYVANRSAETITFYAMPYSGTVSTPCASKYAFEVEEIVANVYTLTTNVVGEGTVEGNEGSYVEGTTATLTASPADHYDFVNWTGDVTSTDNPLTITVNSDLTVTANFQEHAKYTITASAADNTMGYVTGGGTYYAGETVTLKAVANSTYCFVSWSDGNTENPRTFTATEDVTLTANFAKATPRAWAYDLKMVEDGDNYKFSFNATTAANATLLFLDKEGNELYAAHEVGAVAAGANTISIEKAYFTQVKDVYWSVKMDGEAITSVAEITDQTRGIYDFYNMMGVLVDNDPNSNEFGKIYIQASINGASDGATARSDAQKAGLFIYDQGLNELNPTSNVGIAPTVPSEYEWGAAYQFHRLAVDPKTSNLVYSYAIASKPAVFSMDRANLTGTPTNLIEDITGFTRTVAHCFDAEGTLYVMDIASSKGTIYKIKDGVKTVFVPATSKFVNSYISMTSDGRGGLWVSHNRGQLDTYYQLAHVASNGRIDWYVDQTSTHGFTGGAVRGALAYDAERHILAQGRNSTVEVFQVAYDATTGVPTLTKIATTPQVNKANIDALAFDYAGDLYVANSGTEKFYKYTLPTAENICTVPAPESQAIIKEVRYTVTVNTVGNGTATGAGEYVVGETAILKATPAANHKFVNWTYGSETSTDNPLSLVVNGNITVTANFEPVQYTLIAPTNNENKGTVTGAGTYAHGTEVTLEATPKAGYKLLYWSDRSTDNPRTITMTKNEAISAYFVKEYSEEPIFTIEKVWENTNVPASTSNGYQAVGWDGKIYMQDAGHSKIITFSDEADTGTEYATSGVGQQIAVDEAGNLIVFNATFYVENPNSILIYKKGETTNKPISFTLPQPQRCDFFSASGDIYSAEGGYVYFYCKTKQVVNRVKIANGELVSVDVVGNNITAGNTQNHVMLDIFGNLVAHSRSAAINATINVHTSESMAFTLQNHKNTTLGGCTFELGGKEFWAYNVGTTNYTSEWNIYNMTDKKFCSDDVLYAKDKTSTNTAANWLNVQVVNENTAYIYQFCPKVAAAVWKVTMKSDLTLYTVTATATNGSITGAGDYVEGATATLTATPNAGYTFVNWTKGGIEVSTDATYTFIVTEDVELVANFEAIQYTLIAPTNDENKGTVTGAGTYAHGTEVTLTANPAAGYKLLYWSDRSIENPRTITMTKNEAISAYFVKDYAEEPTFTITKVWENAHVPASTTNGYQAVGWDGKIYMPNRTDGKIITYSSAGDTGTDYATCGSGQQIAVDEAGNLIVFNATFSTTNPNAILIYQKGSTEGKAVSFTLKDPAACHFFSASGDIYSAEGGYVYFYCNGKTAINRLKITNGAATTADVTTDIVGGSIYAGGTQNHVMVDIFGNLVTHARSNSVNWINVYTNECKTFTLPSIKFGTLGGCSFELGGKELWAYHAGATNYTSEWNIYNMTDSKFLSDDDFYAVDKSATTNYACNWLNVQVVDENTAYIYQFCPTVAMAVWRVSIQRDDLQEYTVTATANDASMGSVTGGGTYYEGATAILAASANSGYRFVNWTKDETILSTDASFTYTVPAENVTIVANFEPLPEITYELNGGVWNKYGWTSKEDMYNAFVTEWKAYSGSTQYFCSYETQLGIGNSNKGLPTAILSAQPILDFMAQAKWAWLGQFLDALATAQGKATMPTANGIQMRWGLGNFFGEDNNGSTTWHGAVDCSAGQANPEAFQPIWGQSLPHPIQPTTTVVLGNPYKEGYLFDGWYATSDFSGAKVTIVDETTNGTLYAKWLEHRYTRPVTNGNFGTICLPYGSSSYNGAEFYEIAYLELQADGVTPKGIWLDEVIGALEAGKPYIFKATSTQLIVNYEGDAELNPVAGKAGLTGIFEAIPTTNDILEGNYMIAQNKFWLCGTGCWLDANRAYIEHDALHANTTPVSPMPGRRRVMMGAAGTNQATGIDHLTENGTITPTIEGTYDVLGRKMTEPTATGFYIIDGKKVAIVK